MKERSRHAAEDGPAGRLAGQELHVQASQGGETPRNACRLIDSALCALGFWVLGANMGCKLLVALQLEVPHHFIY